MDMVLPRAIARLAVPFFRPASCTVDLRSVLARSGCSTSLRSVPVPDPDLCGGEEPAIVELVEAILSVPEQLPPAFWARAGMAVFPNVVELRSSSEFESVKLHLLTDGRRDWWFLVPNTSSGEGYLIGPPSPASLAARRKEIAEVVAMGDGWLCEVAEVHTSLRGPDRKWLAEFAQRFGASLVRTRGRLVHLTDAIR